MSNRRILAIQVLDPSVGWTETIAYAPSSSQEATPESDFECNLQETPMRVRSHMRDEIHAEVKDSERTKFFTLYNPPAPNQSFPHQEVSAADGGSSNLCVTCEDIEIRSLLSNGHGRSFELGWLQDLARCHVCGLCRLLTHAFEDSGVDIANLKTARRAFVVLTSVATVAPLPSLKCDRPYQLQGLLIDTQTRRLHAEVNIRPLADSAHVIGKSTQFHSRRIHMEAADLDLAKSWIAECCKIHDCEDLASGDDKPVQDPGSRLIVTNGILVEPHKTSDDRLPTHYNAAYDSGAMLRVMDTEDGCLTMIPWSERYVSLSYVWPRFDTLRLLRANSAEFHRSGALTRLRNRLPQVIQDAMDVVGCIGERYLWVDALCITQDDTSEKFQLINAMNKVYGRSTLTLVVATATSPAHDYGIPGIRGTPRTKKQHLEHLEGMDLVTALPDYHVALETTVWISRGWTFQEGILSKRCLIFTDHQMFFRCGRNSRCEDVRAEGCAIRLQQHPAKPAVRRGYLDYAVSSKFLEDGSTDSAFAEYSLLVSGFSPRSFTMPGDILSAFTGIMTALLRSLSGDGFFFGLPIHRFRQAMMWYPTSPLKRREVADFLGTDIPLPTWSWVGWEGKVGYDKYTIGVEEDRPMAFWWRSYQGILLPLCNGARALPDSKLGFGHGMLAARARTMSLMQLILWGNTCRLLVSREETYIREWMVDRDQTLPCFVLLDREGDPCGMLPSADRDWAERHKTNDKPRDSEFLLLSYSGHTALDRTSNRSRFFHPKYKIPLDEGLCCCFYNIMLLEYDSAGVAYRRGIGRVHVEAFDPENVQSNHEGPKIIVLG